MLPIDAGRDGPEENGYSIFKEVEHLLKGIEFMQAQRSARAEVEARVRPWLAFTQGAFWQDCAVHEHRNDAGQTLYTAVARCPNCGDFLSFIFTVEPDGKFNFCAPIED